MIAKVNLHMPSSNDATFFVPLCALFFISHGHLAVELLVSETLGSFTGDYLDSRTGNRLGKRMVKTIFIVVLVLLLTKLLLGIQCSVLQLFFRIF